MFRKHKVWVKSEDIELPGGKIEGPDMNLENKEFVAIVTLNNQEKVTLLQIKNVRQLFV